MLNADASVIPYGHTASASVAQIAFQQAPFLSLRRGCPVGGADIQNVIKLHFAII